MCELCDCRNMDSPECLDFTMKSRKNKIPPECICEGCPYWEKNLSLNEDPSPEDAFIEIWEFIEGQGLDLMAENDLKCALIVLGEAARLPEHLVHGSAGDQAELEAKFFTRNKCGGDDHGDV